MTSTQLASPPSPWVHLFSAEVSSTPLCRPGSSVARATMPRSGSFPSGHSASAFAFAYAVGRHLPALAVPIRLLAAAVAYSRVHTGVHYPGDVVIGSVTGAGTAAMVAAVADRVGRARAASGRAR